MIRSTLYTSQSVLARWSDLLLQTDESAHVLRELSEMTEQMSALFARFIAPPNVASISFEGQDLAQLTQNWRIIAANATAAYIAMTKKMQAAGMVSWDEKSERLLSPTDREELEINVAWRKGHKLRLYDSGCA
jgi:hypothetical protein